SIGTEASEEFDGVQVLERSPEVTLGGVIGGVDDQRMAVPVTHGVPKQLPNVFPDMTAPIQRNDAGIMDPFHENHHGVASLKHLVIAVVRRLNPRCTVCDTPFG